MNNQPHIETVQTPYTTEQFALFAKQIAENEQKIMQLEAEKKAAAEHFKGEIERFRTASSAITNNITRGYAEEEVPCDVYYNQPVKGMKTLVDARIMKIVAEKPMDEKDRQKSFYDSEKDFPEDLTR